MTKKYSHDNLPFVTDLVMLPNGEVGIVESIDRGFDDCVNIRKPDGSLTSREPSQLRYVDEKGSHDQH